MGAGATALLVDRRKETDFSFLLLPVDQAILGSVSSSCSKTADRARFALKKMFWSGEGSGRGLQANSSSSLSLA